MKKRGAYLKKAANIDNVIARNTLLVAGLKNPESVNDFVVKALNNQRSFAALAIVGSKIQPIALNTLKTLANEIYPDSQNSTKGFTDLDNLRVKLKLLVQIKPSSRTNEAKSKRQKENIIDLKNRLSMVEHQSILRSKAYIDIYSKLKNLLKDRDLPELTRLRLYKILEEHHDLFSPLFEPTHDISQSESAAFTIIPGGKQER